MTLNVTEIITRAQRRLNELGANIDVDGVDGEQTWTAIANQLGLNLTQQVHGPDPYSRLDELAGIAETQLGTQEDSKHTNAGDAILKYQRATSLAGQGWPWCAAFVDWCCEQLWAKHPELGRKMPRPDTASAFGLIDWGRKQNCTVFTGAPNSLLAQRGDLVVYTFSHCGIVSKIKGTDGFEAIEGNSNGDGSRDGYEVVRHPRNYGSVKAFIRIPEVAS